ncbi:neuritin-like [Polypterus senegalus]|nr:neuritin-like [Polypterus senegalus]
MELGFKGLTLLLMHTILGWAAGAGGSRCKDIYRGFSECLLRLGDNMSQYVEQELVDSQEIDNVCAHWDEFHACGMAAISDCQLEVQGIWDSLRQESEKLNFQGNLYDLCRKRKQANQDKLMGGAHRTGVPVSLLLGLIVPLNALLY